MRKVAKLFVLLSLAIGLPALAQTSIFNCNSGFSSTGSCKVGILGPSGPFQVVGTGNGSSPALVGSQVLLGSTGATHIALSLNYQTAVNVQAFTTTFTFVPNGQNIVFAINNATGGSFNGPAFSAGAGCEAGFFQAFVPGNPLANKIVGLEFDSYSYLTSTPSFSYSSVQLYQINQSPCNPNDSGPNYWLTNKISTSPVPLNSPAATQNTSTGDTYSATITYDGSNFTLNMYDITAGGSCPGSTCFTQTWNNVDIPAMVNGNTAYVGFTAGTGEASSYPLYVNSWSYTVNSAPSLPSLSTYTTQSNAGASHAANVTFSPAAGTYGSTQSVALSCSTSGSNICYSLTTPSSTTILPWADGQGGCQNGTAYSSPVTVSSSQTLYAICATTYTGLPSAHTSAAYSIGGSTASTPTFSPVAGTYGSTQVVSISTSTSGAIICWNTTGSPVTNGSTGCNSGTLYTGSISVSSNQTVYAVAGGTGFADSSVGSAAYVITIPGITTSEAGFTNSIGGTVQQ